MKFLWSSPSHRALKELSRQELALVISLCDSCMNCSSDAELHAALLEFGHLIGYEFVLYAYMRSSYVPGGRVSLVNLSNPQGWMEEYARARFVEHDPVRIELERWLARAETTGAFAWDAYDRKLDPIEERIIERRTRWGLRSGFSAFCDSKRHDSVFLVSFATRRRQPPTARALLMGRLVAPHLNRCRKRLDLSNLVARFTRREQVVAHWLSEGKSNAEIARILRVTDATAKYHVANILAKLGVNTRQGAVAILIAERSLS